MDQARVRARAVDAELSTLVRRFDESRAALDNAMSRAARSAQQVTDGNAKIASLHQETASIKRRADDIKIEMDRVGPGAIQQRLRRDRARFLVQIEDREKMIANIRDQAEKARLALSAAEEQGENERERSRAIVKSLDALQSQLPRPRLFADLFAARAGLAHGKLYLGEAVPTWRADMLAAIAEMQTLHGELRAGKYRLDKNSDLVGGRATESADAVYAAVAIGDLALARKLFGLVTDPTLFFHNIFNIYRLWLLGLYLDERYEELGNLVRNHQYEGALGGAYALAFRSLVEPNLEALHRALKGIAEKEWAQWQNARLTRAAGVVSLGAVGISQLARRAGMAVRSVGPTIPEKLLGEVARLRLRA
ncbi:MAG: hypothetical protein H7Z43_09535 [Clostridia bacterium]|nr:hypothetical protein [Deltaproteobacteria bacterium]